MKIAFTGSFDPPHLGHKHVVDTCTKMGFEVIVFIASNPDKVNAYSDAERLAMCRDFFGCEVVISKSELVAQDIIAYGVGLIVRGLRNEEDFAYEQVITDFNHCKFNLPTIYVPAPINLRGISSTKIKSQKVFDSINKVV